MKINIGKYPKNCNKKRKIKVKIHEYDVYNLDHTLCYIILPALKLLNKVKHGAPNVDNDDVPEELRNTNSSEKENENSILYTHLYPVMQNRFDRWDYVLEQMIWSFSELSRDWERDYYSGESRFKSIPVDENGNEVEKKKAKYFELRKNDKNTFKIDHAGMEQHREKIQEGLRLFAKYYTALWS